MTIMVMMVMMMVIGRNADDNDCANIEINSNA